MRVVVTGGVGFIGRNIVAELNNRGIDNIIIVEKLGTDEKWKNLLGLRFEDVIGVDVFRDHVRNEKLGKLDAIIHMGACSATTERDADFLLDNNYHYTRDLCEYCLKHDVRFIYASSAATYGDGNLGYSDDDQMTPKFSPLNMYGYSKHMFDLWALKHGLFDKIVGLKYFNVYGPYEDHKDDMRSVVHKAFGQIKKEGIVRLFKSYKPEYQDGCQLRDFVYVKDAVDLTLHFLEHKKFSGLYNCGTGQSRSWLDLANATFSAMGVAPNIEFIEMPESLKPKYQYFTQADSSKLPSAGYTKTFHSLEDGVKDYVQNYLEPNFSK